MSLENIEQYIKEVEAIKNYDRVKREKQVLEGRVKRLEDEVSRCKESLENEKLIKEEHREEVEEKTTQLKQLEKKINELSSDVLSLKETVRIVGDERLSTTELRERIAKVKAEEIKNEAERLLGEFKSEWEKNLKTKEVLTETLKQLEHIVKTLSKPKPHYLSQEMWDSGIPEKVEKILNSEVNKRIDDEFMRRIEDKSDKKALEKLEILKTNEWPRWYNSNIEPKVARLEGLIRDNSLKMLKGPWTITCDKCGLKFGDIELTSEGIGDIIRTGNVEIECQNPNCTDSSLLSTWKHKVKVSLNNLIATYVTGSS